MEKRVLEEQEMAVIEGVGTEGLVQGRGCPRLV